jgi:hypothetical protein
MSGSIDARAFRALGHAAPGPLPAWLDRPAHAVLQDFQAPTPVDIALSYSTPFGEGGWVALIVEERGAQWSWSSCTVPTGLPDAELLVAIADGLQEQVFPEQYATWGEARPACPGHPHPTEPTVIADEAWWICPRDGRRIKRIGHSSDTSSWS